MNLNKEKLVSVWKKNIQRNGNKIKTINFLKYVTRKNNKIVSAFLDAVIITKNKKCITRAVQLEWPSVVIIPILVCGKKIKTLMIEQFRVGTGEKELEFPGGAIENKNILSTAMKETKEELNIHVNKNTLKKLNTKPIKMLASSNSQLVTFFCFKKRVTKNFLKYINNSISGCSNDGEHLKIKVLNFNDVKKINTSSAIIGLSLIKNKII